MCGIGGCFMGGGGTPDRAALTRMVEALGHRGPDDSGIRIAGPAGLAHTRLSIVDPHPRGRQPMQHPGGRWSLTYNGEIFNHLDLRRELAGEYTGGTDTETLLHALAAWGIDAVPRCNGLFSFAAVDAGAGKAFLVRDRFGIKPLYFAEREGGLWFASEIRALAAGGIPLAFDAELLRHNLATGWLAGTSTIFAGVHRLPPGSIMEIDLASGGRQVRRWYDPAAAVDPELGKQLERLDRARLKEKLAKALRASVRRRLMSDVPVGTMCSGGLDSSLITALAREDHPEIHAFNASISDQPDVDESRWAKQVATSLGVELHTAPMTSESWRAGLVAATLHNEHPLVHESSVPMAEIAALARRRGIRVLLSGEGADELFGGYEWLHGAEYRDFAGRADRLQRPLRTAYRRAQGTASHLREALHPRSKAVPATERVHHRGLASRANTAYAHHDPPRRRLEAALLTDLGSYLPHLLNRQDKNTMQHSIETRVPFLDPDVVSLALNLPLEARVEPDRKALLREAAGGLLPAGITKRPKIGFGFDIDRCLGGRFNSGFLEDGLVQRSIADSGEAWRADVCSLSGQALMIHLTAEILGRALIGGQSQASINDELWL